MDTASWIVVGLAFLIAACGAVGLVWNEWRFRRDMARNDLIYRLRMGLLYDKRFSLEMRRRLYELLPSYDEMLKERSKTKLSDWLPALLEFEKKQGSA